MQINTENFKDLENEEAVLSCLIQDIDLLSKISLKREDFYYSKNQNLFSALSRAYQDSQGVDPIVLKQYDPTLKIYEISAIENKGIPALIKHYLKTVHEKSFGRKSFLAVEKIREAINNPESDILSIAESEIDALHSEKNRREPEINFTERLISAYDSIIEAKALSHIGIQTGFKRLNDCCVGFCPSHFWIIGGFTGHGKSILLSQVIDDVCRNGAGVCLFSTEDSVKDKIYRLISTRGQVPIRELYRGWIDPSSLLSLINEIKNYRLHIYDNVYTLDEIDFKIRKHKIQGGLDVVAIDYIQNIRTEHETIYDSMREVASRLFEIAKKYEVCVLGLSQITEEKGSKNIGLRGAQELASAAHVVLWINREEDAKEFNLLIRKNRTFGKTGKIEMEFSEKWTNIREREEHHGGKY